MLWRTESSRIKYHLPIYPKPKGCENDAVAAVRYKTLLLGFAFTAALALVEDMIDYPFFTVFLLSTH